MVADDTEKETLYTNAAEQADDGVKREADAVMNLLHGQLEIADTPIDADEELDACGAVLADLARKHGNADEIEDRADLWASEIAGDLSFTGGSDRIMDAVTPPLREARRDIAEQDIAEKAGDGHRYTLDRGIGIDEYVEEHLTRVLKLDSQDHKSDTKIVFEFDDGTVVEFEDYQHRDPNRFYDDVSVNAPGQIRNKKASLNAADDIDGDPFDDADQWAQDRYRELSLGPEDRPWGLDWNDVITHLEEDLGERVAEAGPNTDAWESLRSAIRNGRAAHDIQSVVDAGTGAVHYNDEHDEIWVPTGMVDNACEDYAADRRSLVHELDARGVTTDEISGVGASESVRSVDPWTRFWRLDASHPEVPVPAVVQEIETSSDPFASSGDAAADGGTTTFGGGEE